MQRDCLPITAHETYGAWRESDHDDLVLAVALACWWAQRCPPWRPDSIGTGKSVMERLPPGVFLTDGHDVRNPPAW